MRLIINGEIVEDLKATNVSELLEELQIQTGRVAVEVNMQVIKKTDYEEYRLSEGDSVEIVNFVGGGQGDE